MHKRVREVGGIGCTADHLLPTRSYPNYLNLLTTFCYIPLSFAYVIPATRVGWITEEQLAVPKRAFAVMGFLDCLAGIMQTVSSGGTWWLEERPVNAPF